MSLVQVQDTSAALRRRAVEVLAKSRSSARPGQHRNIDFVLLALRGRKVGFEKVVSMIDNLIATLNTEQLDDLHKKESCEALFDHADDNRKVLANSLSDLATVIAE